MAAGAGTPVQLGDIRNAGSIRLWRADGELTPPARVVSSHTGSVILRTRPKTDFWRRTSYGFQRDNGHFCEICEIPAGPAADPWADFELTVGFSGEYEEMYDQAGLMLRASPTHWLKAGVEFVDGVRRASVVITRGSRSDWSVVPLAGPASSPFFVRLRGGADGSVAVYWSEAAPEAASGAPPRPSFELMRLADFVVPPAEAGVAKHAVAAGITACSPTSEVGFSVEFVHASCVAPAPRQALHGDDDEGEEATAASASSSSSSSAAVPAAGASARETEALRVASQASSQVSIMASAREIDGDLDAVRVAGGPPRAAAGPAPTGAAAGAATAPGPSSSSSSSSSAAPGGAAAGEDVTTVAAALMSLRVTP